MTLKSQADAILRKLIDARPDFHPRAWLNELPPLDAFGTLIFQVVGQQLSVSRGRDDPTGRAMAALSEPCGSYLFASEFEKGT